MAKSPPRRHAWALHFANSDSEVLALSRPARDGWEYARRLARNAGERRKEALLGDPPYRLTVAVVARETPWETPISINAKIKQARVELFGRDLSDRGMRHRLRKREEIRSREQRQCEMEGCRNPLPLAATARRRYCNEHLAVAARVRRHRSKTT